MIDKWWNDLPLDAKQAPLLTIFKTHLFTLVFNKYQTLILLLLFYAFICFRFCYIYFYIMCGTL